MDELAARSCVRCGKRYDEHFTERHLCDDPQKPGASENVFLMESS